MCCATHFATPIVLDARKTVSNISFFESFLNYVTQLHYTFCSSNWVNCLKSHLFLNCAAHLKSHLIREFFQLSSQMRYTFCNFDRLLDARKTVSNLPYPRDFSRVFSNEQLDALHVLQVQLAIRLQGKCLKSHLTRKFSHLCCQRPYTFCTLTDFQPN